MRHSHLFKVTAVTRRFSVSDLLCCALGYKIVTTWNVWRLVQLSTVLNSDVENKSEYWSILQGDRVMPVGARCAAWLAITWPRWG